MPRRISQEKTKARHNLRAMAPLKLHRPIFFVPGWTDQAATCWLEPYTEHGTRRRKDWEYTLSDWTNKIIPEEDQNKIHIIKLIKNEKNLKLDRCKTGPQKGKLKCTNWEKDETSQYTNFYQFAELLKEKIRETNHKEYDLVGHSMGGLDILAAAMLDPKEDTEPEVQEHIKTEPLQGIQHIITVATPFRGTPGGWIVKHTYLDELLMKNWTDAIRQQAEAMSTDSPYIRTLNHPKKIERLLKNIGKKLYTIGSENDEAVPDENRKIPGAENLHSCHFEMAKHSKRLGITQDPRVILAITKILTL